MSIVLWRVMVLIVEGGITGRPVHHARRLSVHHVAHRRVRTVRPAWTCRQWRKHYTLLRLDHCPVIGGWLLEKLVGPENVVQFFRLVSFSKELQRHFLADAFYRGIVTKCTVRSQLYGTSGPLLRFYCVVSRTREGTTIPSVSLVAVYRPPRVGVGTPGSR
ncbi:hypothetical protein WH47_02304 [Habropoda laboriosa]|uniref:Secreted protein n=1 Tax=Habropoda laboriosa TaxID=597456 RepID=A0A0L7QY77_9HYME|nr:hypothetical protein WH47_02304 [Habropoda laboriosa]